MVREDVDWMVFVLFLFFCSLPQVTHMYVMQGWAFVTTVFRVVHQRRKDLFCLLTHSWVLEANEMTSHPRFFSHFSQVLHLLFFGETLLDLLVETKGAKHLQGERRLIYLQKWGRDRYCGMWLKLVIKMRFSSFTAYIVWFESATVIILENVNTDDALNNLSDVHGDIQVKNSAKFG